MTHLKIVILVNVHQGRGGVDILASIKGPALPALLLSQIENDFLADSDRQWAGWNAAGLFLLPVILAFFNVGGASLTTYTKCRLSEVPKWAQADWQVLTTVQKTACRS